MKNILIIMKKELKRFFTDKRMLMSLILPGLMIYIVYSLLGGVITNSLNTKADYEYQVKVFNNHDYFDLNSIAPSEYKIIITNYDGDDSLEEEKQKLHDDVEKTALIIHFSSEFNINNKESSVSIYYNSTSVESTTIYQYYFAYLFNESKEITSIFKVNEDLNVKYDVATQQDTSKQIISMLLPFLLIILLFTGCMAVSTESIAGEKERGTIATLLITPTKRSHIAIGKIFALTLTSLVSALASFVGLIASLPKLMGDMSIDISMYGLPHYLAILGIMIVIVLLFVCILSIVSTFAKSVKEATSYSSPVMIIVMMIGVYSMFGMNGANVDTLLYLIPVFNAIQCMNAILNLEFNAINILLTLVSNIVLFAIGVVVLVRMFNSEKIMYNK